MFTNCSLFLVWLVTSPKLFFPLGQDLPVSSKKRLEEVCLWTLDISNLNRDVRVICYPKYDGVIQVELNVGYIRLFFCFVVVIFHCIIGNTVKLSQFSKSERTP